ncbi:MAG: hypothetical protein RBS39_12800 [Phycisphaerales bacterium]|nr:hypothetical protein [Phycisphaerales bacterium]
MTLRGPCALACAGAAGLLVVLGGCAGDTAPNSGPDSNVQREGQALFGSGSGDASGSRTTPRTTPRGTLDRWTIMLVRLPEGTAPDQSRVVLQRTMDAGAPEARVEQRGQGLFICTGSYDDPGSPAAQAELKRVRQAEYQGQRVFAQALLLPPETDPGATAVDPRLASYDLKGVRATRGPGALYTLQVGVYGLPPTERRRPTASELAQFRKAAEQAAVRLRADGEEAFFHHGANSSSVTVGVFGKGDHDPVDSPGVESATLRDTRKRHPYNLFNGAALRETVTTAQGPRARLQPSMLVGIPEAP